MFNIYILGRLLAVLSCATEHDKYRAGVSVSIIDSSVIRLVQTSNLYFKWRPRDFNKGQWLVLLDIKYNSMSGSGCGRVSWKFFRHRPIRSLTSTTDRPRNSPTKPPMSAIIESGVYSRYDKF